MASCTRKKEKSRRANRKIARERIRRFYQASIYARYSILVIS
jgi:hypothetical protein